jgi:tetratricopeptide (TPR) repeat protein
MRRIALGCFSLLLVALPANADWVEASSDHFIIYADQSEEVVRKFSERLERFDAAIAHVFGKTRNTPSPSNRVTVFVVPSAARVRKIIGTQDRFLAGIYLPRAGAALAVVPKLRTGSRDDLSGETVLYHEYAHHFLATLTTQAYPRWFTEGFAEFFANVQFRDDGSVILGAAANYRAAELLDAPHVPMEKFLSFDGGASDARSAYTSFYGQSWLLFHYLLMTPGRNREWVTYQQLLASGSSALDAAQGAFGDLDKLDKDMNAYMRRRTLLAKIVAAATINVGPIKVRTLPAGEAEMMPVMMESKVGVSREEALQLVPQARRVAGLHPDDPAVLSALAEVELDAGNDDAAIAAADAALKLDSKQINAYVQKGYALARKVESGALPKESWKDVRAQFIKANAIENDHPIPLVQFYLSYLRQGEEPSKNAIAGLEWAMELAPFDVSLRWLAAQQMVADGRLKDAQLTLGPLAYSPHPGEHTDEARQLLKEVEARLGQEQKASSNSATAQ